MPESSSRTRSDSLDDPEHPEQERKRPRLNSSKPDVAEAMADTAMIPPAPASGASDMERNRDQPITPPSSTNSIDANTTTSPTSKVTINTRAPQSKFSSQTPSNTVLKAVDASHDTTTGSDMTSDELQATIVSAGITDGNSAPPEPISISSSLSGSPEMEVAEIEDYDQESSKTTWTPVSRTIRNTVVQTYHAYYVNQTFPYAARRYVPGTSHKILLEIAGCFLSGFERDGILFQEIKTWLSQFLQRFDRLERSLIMEEPHFWREFPELVSSLLKRETDAPAEARPQDLETFFVDYGRLIVLFIQLDLRQLRSYSDTTDPKEIVELFCRPYLSTLTLILQYREIPFYDTLLKSRSYNPANLISAVADKLADSKSINILHFLTELSIDLASILVKKPAFAHVFLQILTVASRFIGSIPERAHSEADAIFQESPQLEDIKDNSLQFFLQADELLQKAIVKQVAWLTIDNSPDILRIMSRSMQCIADQLEKFRSEMIVSAGVTTEGLDFDEGMQDVVAYAWKFKTLRKYVTHGRMEIRVHGIDAMQNDLVHVFNCYIRNSSNFMRVPLVCFLIKFIQETKFIDYIIGVDSHPQIIGRSSNIVGFLCVTHTFTDYETDIMWKTVMESQDPRTSVGVLELLRTDFGMLELPALHYLCSKLLAIPLQRFEPRMLDFTADLLDAIRQKPQFGHGFNEPHNQITVALCIRLLRDASAAVDCPPEQLLQISHVGAEQLMHLIRPAYLNGSLRVDLQEQACQWRQIAEDIADNNEFATGSVRAMTAWLSGMSAAGAGQLLIEFDIPKLLINNLAYLSEQCLSGKVHENNVDFAFNIRLDALFYVITRVPETITSELLECLWTHLFTAQHLPSATRGKAWSNLSNVVKGPLCDQNSVIDRIVNEYLPRLRPHELTIEVLELIQCCVKYETRIARSVSVDEGEIVSIPGIERVWQVMLEAPPDTVESNATDFLIRQYLDNELITKRSKSCIHATHLSLVDRCVQQVISSAAKLRSYSDGTMSGEDEPMVIIASEEEILAEEMRFDRCLLFLRKFLEGMKARPRYSTPPIKDSNGSQAPFESCGEAFEVKLQVFGSKLLGTNWRQLRLGYSNTGTELWQFLSDMTGFTQFQVIGGGHKIPLKNSTKKLSELGIALSNLLVTKVPDSPEKMPARATRASSPVDTKVMDHFQELYELLELDERLASEVFSFLSLFPAQSGVLGLVRSMQASPDELLPADKPYRLLYCAQALRSCMEDESFSSTPDTDFLHYGITTIIATFSRLEISGPNDALQMSTAQSLLESLLLGFRAKVPADISSTYISDHRSYVEHLLRLARNGRDCSSVVALQIRPQDLVRDPLESLVEGALHDEGVGEYLKSNPATDEVFRETLLTDPRSEVRKAVADIFLNLSGWTGAKLVLKVNNDPRAARSRFSVETIDALLASVWTSLRNLLPEAVSWPFQCQELFEAAVAIFRRVGKTFPQIELNSYFQQWSSLLVNYHHKEV
jgi:ubiquitin carboxyl-terminal hydrolase 34